MLLVGRCMPLFQDAIKEILHLMYTIMCTALYMGKFQATSVFIKTVSRDAGISHNLHGIQHPHFRQGKHLNKNNISGHPKKGLNFVSKWKLACFCYHRKVLFYIKTFLVREKKNICLFYVFVKETFFKSLFTSSTLATTSCSAHLYLRFHFLRLKSLFFYLAPPLSPDPPPHSGHLSSFTSLSPILPSSRPTHRDKHTYTHTHTAALAPIIFKHFSGTRPSQHPLLIAHKCYPNQIRLIKNICKATRMLSP